MSATIQKCLKNCDKRKANSIAFPSIGAGNLGYPNSVVANIMTKEIFDYLSTTKRSKITDVFLMIFMEDTLQAFQKEIAMYDSPGSAGAPVQKKGTKKRKSVFSGTKEKYPVTENPLKSFAINGITVNISSGDITESTCEVIVNPTDSKITLTGEGVAGAILRKGGEELKQLCSDLTSNGLVLDDTTLVIRTRATGLLRSRYLFHICFDGNDPKLFHKIITACLEKAENDGYKSIAFPAIGTGPQRYPDENSASGMLNAIQQFSKKKIYLQHVNIVLFQASTFQTFVHIFQNPSSIETGFMQKAKSLFLGPFGYESEASPAVVPVSVPESVELNITIYGETKKSTAEAGRLFYNFLDEMFTSDSVADPVISDLSGKEEHELKQNSRLKKVEISIDRYPINIIHLKGDTSKVQEMKIIVMKKLSEISERASVQREATILYQAIIWKRMDSDDDESGYDEITNYEIENAYKSNSHGKYTQGKPGSDVHFTIDFVKMKETDHTTHTVCPVIRSDIIEQVKKGNMMIITQL